MANIEYQIAKRGWGGTVNGCLLAVFLGSKASFHAESLPSRLPFGSATQVFPNVMGALSGGL